MYKKDRYDFLQNGSRSEIEKYFNLLYKLSTKNIKYKNMLHMDMNFVKQYGGFSPRNPGLHRKENENENKNENNYYNLLDEDEKIVLSGEKTRTMEINEHNRIHDNYADGYDTEEEWSEWERRMGW